MAFFQQLRLLLWKNGLCVIRHPAWSVTLVIWPLVIFIILAITRQQFPAQLRYACYVAPRNLPSTGFFPFLQTLMCNTDSSCHNKSRLVTPHGSKVKRSNWENGDAKRLDLLHGGPLEDLFKKGKIFDQALTKTSANQESMLDLLNTMLSSSPQAKPSNNSLVDSGINTLQMDQEAMRDILESMGLLKKAICTLALSMVNTSSASPITYATLTFCKSNDTILEVSLITINQILTQLMLNNPTEVVSAVGEAVMLFDLLQKETRLWDSLLTLPRVLAPTSLDQALNDVELLLTNAQGAMHAIQKAYPEAVAPISIVHPYLAGSIDLLQYMQGWPGRDVYITLGDVVSLENSTLSEMIHAVLQEINIPLHKALGLMLDKAMVRCYICNNSSNPVVIAACATGAMDMLLGYISPEKVAKQALLAWSQHVAPGDVAFVRGLLHSLMGGSGGQGGSNNTRSQRSADYMQPQNIEEELFLSVGHVILDILRSFPELDNPLHSLLRAGHTSMQTASLAIDTVQEMMDSILKDAGRLRHVYLALMHNQSETGVLIGQVLDSVVEMVTEVTRPTGPLTCERLLGSFEWLPRLWRAMICQNSSSLEQALLMDWMPLIEKVQELNQTIMGQATYEITLPMILSEWHRLATSSANVGLFLDKFASELGVNYWMDFLPQNITYDLAGTLLQRVVLAMGTLGESLETSDLWPQAKSYVHMVYWIVNYQPGITTQPPNCSVDANTFGIYCDTGLNWPQFAQVTAHGLLTLPNKPDFLISCVKATVNLLQHVYGDIYKYLAASLLNQEITDGGEALSAHLVNLVNRLDGYVQKITTLSDSDLSNDNLMLPLTYNLLQSTGLTPLIPLLSGEGPLNISTLVDVAVKLARHNRHIFNLNETDPLLPELESLMKKLLSLDLTLPLSFSMGQTLITYSLSLRPEEMAHLIEAIRPFTNLTSAGIVESILHAMELLKNVTNATNGDPTHIILAYLRQLQEFLASALRLRRIDQLWLPNGQLSTAQVTDLYLVAMDLLTLFTPEGLQNLNQAGPDAAQQIVIKKMLAILPYEVQQLAFGLIQDLQTVINQMSHCTAQGQNCVAGVTEIFTFLEQIVKLVQEAKGNFTITIAPTLKPFLQNEEALHMTATLVTLSLTQRDAAYLKTFNQTLYFLKLVLARPNITVSDVLAALRESDLTLDELEAISALVGASDINELMVSIVDIINVRQCFMPPQSPVIPAQCVMGLVTGITGFLTNIPALQDQVAILSPIPLIVNKTISNLVKLDFSDPHRSTIQVLNSTLASVKLGLQLNHLNSSEIMNEISVVEGLIKLAANMQPFNLINATLMEDPLHAQKVYLEIAEWYLEKLENVTSTSAFADLLDFFYSVTEMQVAMQLTQLDYSLYVSEKVEQLLTNLHYPIDGTGVSMIGQTAVAILRGQVEIQLDNLKGYWQGIGIPSPVNNTELYVIEYQINQYLDLIVNWMRDPSVTSVLTSTLQWGSPSMNISTPGRDIHRLLMTMAHVLTPEQQTYLSAIGHITEALTSALMAAEQPGGLQSVRFSNAILEAAQIMMKSLTAVTGPIPSTTQEKVLGILQDSLRLIVNPQLGDTASRNITLDILKTAEALVQETIPEVAAHYLLAGIQVATTYLETVSMSGGPDKWNEIIFKEMELIQSLLPPNCTAQAYISTIIHITQFIFESGLLRPNSTAQNYISTIRDITQFIFESNLLPPNITAQAYFSTISEITQLIFESGLLPPNITAQDYISTIRDITQLIYESGLLPPNIMAQAYISNIINISQFIFESSLLPPNTTAQAYISTISDITNFILESNLLPPNITAQAYISTIRDIIHFILESNLLTPNITAQAYISTITNITNFMLESGLLPSINMAQAYISTIINITQFIFESGLLPPNITAQAYISTIRDITQFILESNLLPPNITAQAYISTIRDITQFIFESVLLPPNITAQAYFSTIRDIIQVIFESGLLTPNITAQAYISTISDITHFILESNLLPQINTAQDYISTIINITQLIFESGLLPQSNMAQAYISTIKDIIQVIFESGLLTPNITAQAYISTIGDITNFILESNLLPLINTTQAYISTIGDIINLILETSQGNVAGLTSQMGNILNALLQLITGDPGFAVNIPSMEVFTGLGPVLEQMVTAQASQHTWHRFGKMLEALLSAFHGTPLWDHIPPVAALIEKVLGAQVNSGMAENALILGLQRPLIHLLAEISNSTNTSQLDLAAVAERMLLAIQLTVEAAEQANGTLKCRETLEFWEPVGEAAGLSQNTLAAWCDISLRPLLEAYAAEDSVYDALDLSSSGVGPTSVNATAARLVEALRSFYQVNLNSTLITEKLIMTVSDQLTQLGGLPLSLETQIQWAMGFLDMQLRQSLDTIRLLSDQLVSVEPSLQPILEAMDRALSHILNNYHSIQNGTSAEKLLEEAGAIFLTSLNITSDSVLPMLLEKLSMFDGMTVSYLIKEVVKLIVQMEVFGDMPMVYQAMELFIASNDTTLVMTKLSEIFALLGSGQVSLMELLTQALPRMDEAFGALLSFVKQTTQGTSAVTDVFVDLVGNIIAMLRQMAGTSDLLAPLDHYLSRQPREEGQKVMHNNGGHSRRRRDAPWSSPMMIQPMDDFIDLFYVDYPALFKAASVPPTVPEIVETAHVFFGNQDLAVVMNGVTRDVPWGLNSTKDETIDATLGVLSYMTLPNTLQSFGLDKLVYIVNMLPDGLPFVPLIKNVLGGLARETQENQLLLQQTTETLYQLFNASLTDGRIPLLLNHLTSQVCAIETFTSIQELILALSVTPGLVCESLLPSLQILAQSLEDSSELSNAIFQTFIGDPVDYKVKTNWTSVFSEMLGLNTTSLLSLNINTSAPGVVTVGEMVRNKTAFVLDIQRYATFNPQVLSLLMDTPLPNNNMVILSRLVNLRHCGNPSPLYTNQTDETIFRTFCSMRAEQWYSLALLTTRHVNTEKLIYRMVLSDDLQSVVGVMLQMARFLVEMMNKLLPTIDRLQSYLYSIKDLNLPASTEFRKVMKGQSQHMSSKATFTTLSRAMCSNGIIALFGIAKLPMASVSDPSSPSGQEKEEMIDKFKIPRTASPFCMNMYLDMVNTTGGAIAWAFLKPMLMGHILYTPDTPLTRTIMQKSNATLEEFANLRKYSEDWIDSSSYIVKSAKILSSTLPMLQNSLGNSFVENFIQMQTDIDVSNMKETLSSFSNMTVMLEKNKHILKQITTLSNLMVNISTCIKFDRYRGYDSDDELNAEAQDLAKNRNLFASVIFKLPKDQKKQNSSRKGRDTSSSFSSSTVSLPPKVSYTIRMHMDNVMRTDRVRNPYFVKQTHISARQTLRYNRGFIYLQETIERAIIETQTGHKVSEPAVQLQPFPYPCHLRDEYLEAVSLVFPIMLMMAWVLFVADFVKKLVHERELRLHEYMKMMGVNPLSHFCAWFLECAAYLVITIVILTMVLKFGLVLPNSDGFLLFLYFCDYGLSIVAISFLVSSFFDKTYIAGLSGSLIYVLCFFPFIVVIALESSLTFAQKSALSLFAPTCFCYASQYMARYESQGEGIQWSNAYISPMAGDTASFAWLCWLMLIDSILYFIIGAYIRLVFPGKYGIPVPWYFPLMPSFWTDLCCCCRKEPSGSRGLLFTNIMQKNQPVFHTDTDKGKGGNTFSSQEDEEFSGLPVGVALHGLTKTYGERAAIQNLNVTFYEGHVTSLLGHNGAGKTTTMSLLTGLFAPSSGSIEVYGREMQANINDIRKDLGVCMQYDVHFDHMTTKEHLLLYGQIKAPHWSRRELHEHVRKTLKETGMYDHRHKRVGTLSGGMKRKLSISIAFIGGSRLVVLDEPTTGVDPCSRRSIWDIVIQHKRDRTIIMSTHHLDEAEVLSDRIALLERGGLKCCGSPFHLKDKLGQGYNLTLTKKLQSPDSEVKLDSAELKVFIQAHVPEARLKEGQVGDQVYSLPRYSSTNASSYRSLLTALDANLDSLQLDCYGISDTTLEEVFLQLTQDDPEPDVDSRPLTVSESVSDTGSVDSFPEDLNGSEFSFNDKDSLTGSSMVQGLALAWQQMMAILIKRFHHTRRDWKGLLSQILLPVLFVVFAMGLGAIKNDLQHFPEMELSPALYNIGPSYSFFSNQNPKSSKLVDTMMSFPGMDNACLNKPDNLACSGHTRDQWRTSGNISQPFTPCKCTEKEQTCTEQTYRPPHKKISSSQTVYDLSGIDVENYLLATADDYIRNRYGGFVFGKPLPPGLQMDLMKVPKNRTLAKVWYNPEGHHTMPAYLNSLNNFILRSNLPADKDPRKYAISVSSHPYFGRADDEDAVVQGMIQTLVALLVLTGYAITTASFAVYEVQETHSGSKGLQHIAGISEPFYWAVNFFYDMVLYLVPVALTVGVVAAFQIPAFTNRQNLAAVTLLLVLYGFSTFPWMYLLSSVFRDAEMAFITYVCINLFISVNTIMSTSILYFLGQVAAHGENIDITFHQLSKAFLIFPQFSFGNGLMKLARSNMEVQLLSGYGIDAYKNPFSTDALGWLFVSAFVQGLFFFTLRLLLNKWLIRKVRHMILGRKTLPEGAGEGEDEDVLAEHQRVSSGSASSDVLQVNQLTKIYQHLSKKVHAVKKLSVGIPAGECFGLLGVNGAGKTTTFKMLTGDVSPTDGTAQIKDRNGRMVDIMECRNQGINIGYCPQVDALDDLLTGEEHLYFYARVHGISKKEIDGVVNYLLKKLELGYHRKNITDSYSCGTRRKLSTALALIGHPQILLLDEPSSGMDPRTKRHLWKIISEEVKGKCAVVLTSHSMEECEALCTRLAIMVKGQFRCLGSLQHIKNRFGSGFTVKMYLVKASCDMEAITSFMQNHFPSTYLKDHHSNMVEYHVPIAPGGVADIFDQLESNKAVLQIKHFSVSQTTLDEVFINFAMGNVGMETVPLHGDEDSHSLDSIEALDT